MRTILFCNARDEKHLVEWAVHHEKLGFSTIYITDHKSIVPVKASDMPMNVIVKRCEKDIRKHMRMFQAVQQACRENQDWMMYLDADEFLSIRDGNIQDLLVKQSSYDQVGFHWLMFGSNFLDESPKSILQHYIRSDEFLDFHLKTIVRPRSVNLSGLIMPHQYALKPRCRSVAWNNELLNDKDPWFYPGIHQRKYKFFEVPAFIAHYANQSQDTYVQRKVNLPRDDNFQFRSALEKDAFHAQFNVCENTYLCDKYKQDKTCAIHYSEKDKTHAPEKDKTPQKIEKKSNVPTDSGFNSRNQADRQPDLKQAFGQDAAKLWRHWITHGIYEQRVCT